MSNKEVKIDAQTRKSKKNKELRKNGFIPAVVYGYKIENQILKLRRSDFEKAYENSGEAGLIELNIDSKEKKIVVVKEVQEDCVSGKYIHVDFYQIDMKKEIEVEIPLNFIGQSEVVKTKGGILAKNLVAINIRALPGNLIRSVDVDLNKLESFSDKIKVSDLKVPENVEITSDENSLVVNVLEPKIVKKEKTEEEKSEEGEEQKEGESKEGEEEGANKEEAK